MKWFDCPSNAGWIRRDNRVFERASKVEIVERWMFIEDPNAVLRSSVALRGRLPLRISMRANAAAAGDCVKSLSSSGIWSKMGSLSLWMLVKVPTCWSSALLCSSASLNSSRSLSSHSSSPCSCSCSSPSLSVSSCSSSSPLSISSNSESSRGS